MGLNDREPHDAAINDWNHKDIWTRRGDNFCIEVSKHCVPLSQYSPERGQNRWCVYAYIYPNHPYLAKLDGTDMFQAATNDMPLHGGCSFLRWHYTKDGTVMSVQVGADYDHLYDEYYSHCETKNEAHNIFYDAIELYNWLEIRNAPCYEPEQENRDE